MRSADVDLISPAADLDSLVAWAREVSDVLKAAAHEGRFLVLCLLAGGEKSVSELEETMTLPQSAVSQHLARLRHGRLVKARRDGRTVYYSLASADVCAMMASLCELAGGKDDAVEAGQGSIPKNTARLFAYCDMRP